MPSSDENPPASQVASRRSHYGRLVETFRFQDLRVLWASTLCSQFGQGMQQVILVWLMYELTGSVIKVAQIYAVRSLPNLLVGLAALALIMAVVMPRLRKL